MCDPQPSTSLKCAAVNLKAIAVAALVLVLVGVGIAAATESSGPALSAPHHRQQARAKSHGAGKGCRKPVILMVHGGGWYRGDPSYVDHAIRYTKQRGGFTTVGVRYSLHSVGAAFRDLERAARHWRDRGCRVFAYGESNGANMVENLASRGLVSAAAAVSPPTDLLSWSYPAVSDRTYGEDLSTPHGREYAENPASNPKSWGYLHGTPKVLGNLSPSRHPYNARRQAQLLIFQSCVDHVVKCQMNRDYAHSDQRASSGTSNKIHYKPVGGEHATPKVKIAAFKVSYRWFQKLAR